MQVLHISGAVSWRGGEQQLVNLHDALKKKAVQQAIFCPKNSALAKYCKANGLQYFTFSGSGGFNVVAAFQLKKLVTSNAAYSLVHLHDSDAHSIGYLAGLLGVKTPMVLSRKVIFGIKNSFFTKWKYNASCIRKIVCVSNAVKEVVRKKIKDPSKLVVVYEGIKPPASKLPSFVLPTQIREKHFDFLIGYAAALTVEKDHDTFLQTAKLLLEKNPHIGFLLAGTGKEKNNIAEKIRQMGLTGNVFMLGFCDQVPSLMNKLDLLLFTSRQEGFPVTILEAFYSSLPVVATAAGGIPEMIEDGITGFLCEPGDATTLSLKVQEILGNEALRKTITENAYRFVLRFNDDTMAGNMLNVYNSILLQNQE